MDSELIESIAEVLDVPLGPLTRLWLTADNFTHRVRLGLIRRWDRTPWRREKGGSGGQSMPAALATSGPKRRKIRKSHESLVIESSCSRCC
jgi:hypothetical protein